MKRPVVNIGGHGFDAIDRIAVRLLFVGDVMLRRIRKGKFP